jgi:tryptophanyl-tRNA synthetase
MAARPEAANLIGIFAALADMTPAAVCARFGGQNFSSFKAELADLAVSVLGPIGDEMQRLMAEPGYVDSVLHRGAERAGEIARHHMAEIHRIMGLLRP